MSKEISAEIATLIGHLSGFSAARVVVIGDTMLDRFVYGSVERISPEAPIPVLRVEREAAMLGGAGNVASNVAALGATAVLVTVAGADAAAGEITRLLDADARIEPYVTVEAGRPTTVKIRFVGSSQQLLRADSETTDCVHDLTRAKILQLLDGIAGPGTVVLLSDYAKGVLSGEFAGAVIAAAKAKGCRVIVDPKGKDYSRYAGADLITPNNHELAEASRLPVGSDHEVVAAARTIIESTGVGAVLATRGAKGMALVCDDGDPLLVPAQAREVFDVSGAGDTAIATLSVALASGAPLAEAAMLANTAAGIAVAKLGTSTCSVDELATALSQMSHGALESKIADRGELVRQVARWRASGRRVGFTNGCFDILHPGHVSLLRQAKATCDRLVVGLNSDASVKRLKGDSRPINPETARATVLASIADVDLVAIFDEDTPLAMIEAVRPDVLIKGADYTEDQVVGGAFVRSYGGRVALADLSPGFSTTGIVKKMTGAG